MKLEEAIRILDPETSKEALLPYAYDNHQRRKVVDEACRVTVDELRKRQWISVKDKLPDKAEDVLVCFKTLGGLSFVHIARYSYNEWLMDGRSLSYSNKITHWMPMPESPEVKE